jgi:predicted transcriptional regulator
MKLVEHNGLTHTLLSFCGLNLKKHRSILDELESNEFIRKHGLPYGKRSIFVYKATPKGLEFAQPFWNLTKLYFLERGPRTIIIKTQYIQRSEIDNGERQKDIVEVLDRK